MKITKKTRKPTPPGKCLKDLRALLKAYDSFLSSFETVFHCDWDHTASVITDPEFVANSESFLMSDFDESDPWSNRHALISSYKDLIEKLGRRPAWERP